MATLRSTVGAWATSIYQHARHQSCDASSTPTANAHHETFLTMFRSKPRRATTTATLASPSTAASTEAVVQNDGVEVTQSNSDSSADSNEGPKIKLPKLPKLPELSWRMLYDWTIEPSSNFYYRWLIVITLAVMYNLTLIIARAVLPDLQVLYRATWISLDYVSDTVYLIDMVVRFRTTYLEHGLVVRDKTKLRRHYVGTIQFVLDIASLAPTDLLYLYFGIDSGTIVRINRILRIPRMREFFERTDSRTNYPHIFRLIQLIVLMIICIHWNACFYFQISSWIGLGVDQWVYFGPNGTYPDYDQLLPIYTYSFYWSTLMLAMMGDVPHPTTVVEYWIVVCEILIAVLVFAAIIGNVGNIITSMNAERDEFQGKMDGVKRYMILRRVNKDIQRRVISWFGYLWINKQTIDEQEVLAALPEKLRAEIAMQVHLETLKRVAIFQECEAGLLVELVLKLQLAVFSPGDYVCRKGDIGRELYIIKRGKLTVVSDDGQKVFATLGEGVVFGEISILDIAGNKNGNRRTANIRSVGYSDLFVLSKEDLWTALAEYPEARQRLLEKGRQMLRKDNLLDEEVARLQDLDRMTAAEKLGRLETALTDTLDRLSQLTNEFNEVQRQLKQRVTKAEKQLRKDQERQEVMATPRDLLAVPGQPPY